MEIAEDRYGRGSTLITSQLPLNKWHDVVDDPTFADAILDRIVHNAYQLALDGPSMRKLKANRLPDPRRPTLHDPGRQAPKFLNQATRGRPMMIAATSSPTAPVGQQGPPTRAPLRLP